MKTLKEKIQELLMPYEDYHKSNKKIPYSYIIKRNNNNIFYFGANHSKDPANEQYPLLRDFWRLFLKEVGTVDSAVFVEGGLRSVAETEDEAIKNNSEAGLITYLASHEGVEVFCPEPQRKDEYRFLEKTFKKEEIQYYYFARIAHSWHKFLNKPPFEEYVERYLLRDSKESGWRDFDFSLDSMKKIHKNLFDEEFKNDEKTSFLHINPTKDYSIINKVAKASSEFRNLAIVKSILDFNSRGKNIFIVFGGSHAIVQEKALKEIL